MSAKATTLIGASAVSRWLEKRSQTTITWLTLTATAGIAIGDWVTGADLAFTAMYLAPIAIAAWYGHRLVGPLLSALASALWLAVEFLSGASGSMLIVAWNFVVELGVFVFTAVTIRKLRLTLVEERQAVQREHEQRLSAQRQLQHAERLVTVGKLAAGVAHELGTPLNVVSSYSQLIEAGTLRSDEVPASARIIREQTETMTRIIRQLVDFARAGSARRTRQNVRDLIGASLSMLAPIAKKRQVTLVAEPGSPLEIDVDSGQLQQVLTNLLVNAIQAVAERGRVRVGAESTMAKPPPHVSEHPARWVAVHVTDDGQGISDAVMQHLFEPFVTTKGVGEGTGLGLAVAYGIIREHGGWIVAENGATGGARFSVYLPDIT